MKARWKITFGAVCMAYLVAPFFAGVFELGHRSGPVLWPENWHDGFFIIGCEGANGYKPRVGLESLFLRRAIFYGLPQRPYPKEKRLQIIEDCKKRDLYSINWILTTEAQISEMEANGQYSIFDNRRKFRIHMKDQ